MSESDFFVSAVLGTLGCYCAEGLNESGVLGLVHYVGDTVCGDVNELGCFVGVKVGGDVRSLADRGTSGFDRVVADVRSLVVSYIVCLLDVAGEGEAEPLFKVLSVVLVGAFKVFAKCDGFHSGDFLSLF